LLHAAAIYDRQADNIGNGAEAVAAE